MLHPQKPRDAQNQASDTNKKIKHMKKNITDAKEPIQVIVVDLQNVGIIQEVLTPENYNGFPRENTYSVIGQSIDAIPEDFNGIIIIGDYPGGKDTSLNKLAQTKISRRTICIGDYSRKDHIEIGGFWWCDTHFAITTALPELINKIVAKTK
jgi:hypothetical protein